MLRYCSNCKKDFDFDTLSVSGKDDLICPECGCIIDKNSRNPAGKLLAEETEEKIGRAYAELLHLSYIFYMSVGVIGVIGFILGIHWLLYAATAVSLAAYIIQFLTGTLIFKSGLFLLPIGAIAGYMYFGNISGACLAIHIVFLIRHLIRDIIFRLIFAFFNVISRY